MSRRQQSIGTPTGEPTDPRAEFFELAPDLFTITDATGILLEINSAWERTLGYAREELLGRLFLDFVHPADISASRFQAEKIAAGGEMVSFTNRFVTKNGDDRWFSWSATLSDDGRNIFAAGKDITLEVLHEAEINEARAKLEALLAAAVDGVLTIDELGIIRMVNPAVGALFGYDAKELLGKNVSILMPEPYHSEHDDYLKRFIRTGEARIIGTGRDLTGRRKDGSTFPIYLSVGELPDARGREFVGIVRDISERQAALTQLRDQGLQLAEASAAAKSANRLKSDFLANMSHELRTPLNAVLGFSQLLRDGEAGPVTAQQKEFLTLVLSSANHLLQLVNDVLDLSKVEAGRLEFHPVSLNVQKMVDEVLGVVRELATRKRLQITIDLDHSVPEVVLDPIRLKQVLYNFLSNAIKFTPAEGHILVRARAAPGGQVRFEVEDTGIGIAQADLENLFADFSQVGPRRHHEAGTGLGLSLTRKLVEAQGGQVGVSSQEGVGCTFYALLPRGKTDLAKSPPLHSRETKVQPKHSATTIRPEHPAGPSILVVEDDARERSWLRRTLGEAGYVVTTAATGAEAIRHASAARYQAITLDMYLPDMAGLDVLTQIRRSMLNENTPTVIVTVVPDQSLLTGVQIQLQGVAQAIVGKGAGAADVLLKTLDELVGGGR